MVDDNQNDDPLKKDFSEDDEDARIGLSETIKKVFAIGSAAAFLTEESIRSALGEIKLPKEILRGILQSALKSKEDITNRVSKEILAIVSKIDFVKEASRFVEEHKFKITAEVEVTRKEGTGGKNNSDVNVKFE